MTPSPEANAPAFTVATDTHITVNPDRTSRQRFTIRFAIARESALRVIGQQSVAFVDGMETLDITEAFTEKADGRKVPVDPATILTRDAATGLNAVYLRDSKTRTLIFPDIAVGDTLVYTAQRDIKQTAFEGQFSHSALFQRSYPFTKLSTTITAPNSLKLRVKISSPEIDHKTSIDGDTAKHTFVYTAPESRIAEEPGAVSPLDREPGFTVSTFTSYEELGLAYWRDAAPKSAVSPEIQTLAAEIVRGLDNKRAEADAIDRWVKRNVRYVAVYLGRQRWIPNAANTILTNKYGDCKDMVTLMSALLKARGIAVEHVLINLGNAYQLPELPPGHFNHAILYLPEFNLYNDPTATLSGFGILSQPTYDKPALHVSEKGARLARTPVIKPDDHVATARTKVSVTKDGTVEGTTVQTGTGFFAASARSYFLRAQGEGFERNAENLLAAMRTPGKGKFEATSPSELKDPYTVTATFALSDKLAVPLRGARRMPVGLPILARPGTYLLAARNKDRREAFVCLGGRQIEEIDITFAPELAMPRRPNARSIETKAFTYKATYTIDDRVMKVRREFTSRVASQVCPPDLEKELAEPSKTTIASIVSPLIFGSTGENPPGDYAKLPPKEPAKSK